MFLSLLISSLLANSIWFFDCGMVENGIVEPDCPSAGISGWMYLNLNIGPLS